MCRLSVGEVLLYIPMDIDIHIYLWMHNRSLYRGYLCVYVYTHTLYTIYIYIHLYIGLCISYIPGAVVESVECRPSVRENGSLVPS